MEDHPRGFCDVIAQIPGVSDPDWEKGDQWLEHQTEERQREIMGDTRYELWQNGTNPRDMVRFVEDPFYGRQPAIRNLGDTKGYDEYKESLKQERTVEKVTERDYFSNYTKGDDLTLTDMEKSIDEYMNLGDRALRQLRVGNGDGELGYLYKMQGYDGLPSTVTQAEFDILEKNGEVRRCYRGVSDSMNGNASDFVNQFKYGEHYPGYGMYGNGTYLAEYTGNSNAWDTAYSYASNVSNNIMTVGVKADARIINKYDLNKVINCVVNGGSNSEYNQLVGIVSNTRAGVEETIMRLRDQATKINWGDFYSDPGKVASMLGFDGINVTDRSYIVLLNRTAAVVVK
jgi:hypothetical protein